MGPDRYRASLNGFASSFEICFLFCDFLIAKATKLHNLVTSEHIANGIKTFIFEFTQVDVI